jgi:hypothetical protein
MPPKSQPTSSQMSPPPFKNWRPPIWVADFTEQSTGRHRHSSGIWRPPLHAWRPQICSRTGGRTRILILQLNWMVTEYLLLESVSQQSHLQAVAPEFSGLHIKRTASSGPFLPCMSMHPSAGFFLQCPTPNDREKIHGFLAR